MSSREQLRCDLTRLLDNSPCCYETVIDELERQLRWFRKDLKREIAAVKSERKSKRAK